MVRWLRFAAWGAFVVSLIGVGVGLGLFLWANDGWVPVTVPPWLTGLFGDPKLELWLPGLIGGWLLAVLAVSVVVAWSMFYVWRRRQYEALVKKLEWELSELRNLPFTAPAPLEDIPEEPDAATAQLLEPPEQDLLSEPS